MKGLQFNSVTEQVLRLPNQSCSPLTPSPLLPWGGVASCQVPECVREPGWASLAVSHLCDPQYYCPVRIQITTEPAFASFPSSRNQVVERSNIKQSEFKETQQW